MCRYLRTTLYHFKMLSAVFTTLLMAGIADISADFEDFPSPLFFVRREEVGVRAKRMGPLMHCSEVTEHPFANCHKLKSSGKCSSSPTRLRRWCPRTCKFCIAERAGAAPAVCSKTKFGCCADGIAYAKGPNKEGCPENCKNVPRFHCHWYAKHGFCTTHMQTMKKFCPKACKFCGRKIVNGCFNLWEDPICKHLAQTGACRFKKWRKRLIKNCARSCEICTANSPTLKQVKPRCSKAGCCWDNKTPIYKGCPPCKDYFARALCQRFKSDCSKIGRIQGVQMRIFCPDTCGICNQKECKDDLTFGNFCKEWKTKGECQRDPLAMKVFCKKTCNFC